LIFYMKIEPIHAMLFVKKIVQIWEFYIWIFYLFK
jgi:hypothetical protein